MTEKLKEATLLDHFASLLTGLTKVFSYINYPFLVAKIDSYGVSHFSTKITLSYLSNRTQQSKINSLMPGVYKLKQRLHILKQGLFNYA